MNKNEKFQFKLLKTLIKQGMGNSFDIFENCIDFKKAEEPYDAVAIFEDHKKYIQITTMSNLIMGNKNKIQHANKHNLELKANFNEKFIKKNINYLRNLNIKRQIVKKKGKSLHISDKFSHTLPIEENLDHKYNIYTAGLINATYRSIINKISKYNIKDKKRESILIIINNSNNVFHWKPIVNFAGINASIKKEIKNWKIYDYFKSILFTAIKESNFKDNKFFNGIQVYYRSYNFNCSSNSNDKFYIANNKLTNGIPINHIANSKIAPISRNNEHKRISIINDFEKV